MWKEGCMLFLTLMQIFVFKCKHSYCTIYTMRYHDICVDKKISIVPCCGFDCLPSDISCFLAANALAKEYDENCVSTESVILKMHGGVSGGTIHTILNIFDSVTFSFF